MQGKLHDLLDWSDGTALYERNLLEKVLEYEMVVIFGAGIGGKMTYELLEKHGLSEKVKVFSDNNPDKIGSCYMNIPVVAPEEIVERLTLPLVLISSTAYDLIRGQLLDMGIVAENIYYFQPAGISLDCEEDKRFIEENIDKFDSVYQLLNDEKSKRIYRYLLNYRISKKLNWLEEMRSLIDLEREQYFDADILKNYCFEDGFVDCGAYTGDTIACFYEHFPKWSGKCYCLEAGNDIYMQLCENVKKINQEKIVTLNYAVWDKAGELHFDTTSFGNGGGSHVSEDGETVKCNSLDNLLDDECIEFIKMDIEGAEKKALEGARTIIQKNSPILAVCIYHKPEDFFAIPLLLQDMMYDKYEFYIRQYRYGQSETVLYAMPKNRKLR